MNIISFEKLDSTNTYAKLNIKRLADKTVVSANIQTNGHGRFDRSWVDLGTENIYITFVLKPSDRLLPEHANLTQYLSVVICKQLEELGLSPQIKWPNDVLLGGKKVCGILAETVIKEGMLKGIALGVGINLNASIDSLGSIDNPATSLNLELGHAVDKQKFMENLVANFFKNYDEFLKNGFKYIKSDYEKRACLKGKEKWENGNEGLTMVKISVFNKIISGEFGGFDDDGTLLLLLPDGKVKKINMGEII